MVVSDYHASCLLRDGTSIFFPLLETIENDRLDRKSSHHCLSACWFAVVYCHSCSCNVRFLLGRCAAYCDCDRVIYRLIDTPMLLALPLFTFSGYVLAESGLSSRLVKFTSLVMGWMPAGLAIVSLFVCAFFTAFTGASGVTIVAVGALIFPALIAGGYNERYSLGLVTTSGSLGLLLAPSLPLILYGVIAQQMDLPTPFSLRDLFLAGAIPALLMIFSLSVYSIWATKDLPLIRERFDRVQVFSQFKELR